MEGSYSQAGFYYQNNVAALKIIECLFFDSGIREIRLENYEKGNHIDDIIIYRKDKIDYFQVKWSEDDDKSYTLYSLISSQESTDPAKKQKKSIFKQLAEGYLGAKKNSKNFSITLFTNKKESSQKRPSEDVHHNLSEIRTNIFDPLKNSDIRYDSMANFEEYKITIEKIRQECGLDENSFNEFIKSLEFKFNQESIEQVQNAIKFKLDNLGIELHLFEKILNAAVKWSISGESITKDSVLKELGISDRFEDKLSHYFKVIDDEYYVPNQSLFLKLEKALTELAGGYIFIEGLPGIGKSTALTKFKEQSEDITLAYYCFIPDTKNDFGELRHQSYYFLKSLCIAIEKNFGEVDFPNMYSERYEEKLISHIDKLSKLKRKIIFIIDGLDHVHRDTTVGERSLLNYIKGNLPDNIYFILSSQYDEVLSDSVKLQIDADERRHIKVPPFVQSEIKQYLDNKAIIVTELLDKVQRVSGGIPVYLHYISELLSKVEQRNYESTLNELPALVNGAINSYHEYLFQKIEGNIFAKWVLAVLAYRKENTSIDTIKEILRLAGENRSIIEIESAINGYSHLLRQIDGRSYSIFHNSFREFIITKTADLKETFNKALASFYEQNLFADEAYRNYFSHLYEIGEYKKIISIATLEWIKSAWSNYRSIEEIKNNLDFAIRAAIADTSLNEFIRIAFLKDQVDTLEWNLSGTEINFSRLFLNVGETANSLRLIWDGDFVLTNKEYFCFYLGEYYKKTKALLPHNIISQGLSKPLTEHYVKNTSIELKAKALILENIVELFEDIEDISWEQTDRHNKTYLKKEYSDKRNKQINLKIKSDIISYLSDCNHYSKLLQLLQTYKKDLKLLPRIQIALVKLFLPSPAEKKSAVKIIREIDFANIPDKSYFRFISYCCDFLTNEEIVELFPSRAISEPELFEEVVNKDGMTFSIRKEIISFYDDLKPIVIFQPELIERLALKNSFLLSPAEEIYDSIFNLSELWNLSRTSDIGEDEILDKLKMSIDSLYIKRVKEFTTRARGLFDMDTDSSFIAGSMKNIFSKIFKLSVKLLSQEKLEDLVSYWITCDKSGNGFPHYSAGLAIAEEINNNSSKKFPDLTYKVIKHAEESARKEHDTGSLTSYLGEVAEAYGKSGYKEDFKRIYNQLVEISFGVGHRKDYKASNIIEPMELLHASDPSNTLKRLSEVLHIQDRINDAGNGRMRHIVLSNLIRFTAGSYPELAFKLLELEETNIGRDEAFDIVLSPLINSCSNEDLEFHLAIIKTLSRWSNGGSIEGHFIDLAKKLLSRAIHYNNNDVVEKILKIVKFNTTVEIEDEKELSKFSEILKENGIDYHSYGLPDPLITTIDKTDDQVNRRKNSQKVKFKISETELPFEEIIELFEDNYEEFEKYVQNQFRVQTQNDRNQSLKTEYGSVKKIFENFHKITSSENKDALKANQFKIRRQYAILKNEIASSDSESLNLKDIKKQFDKLILFIDSIISENEFASFVYEKMDFVKWLDNMLSNFNRQRDYLSYFIFSDEELNALVDQCSIMSIENLIQFIERWTRRTSRSKALLKIANRLIGINPNRAKEIALLASEFEFDSQLFQRNDDPEKLDFDIIEMILKVDEDFGKKFLLNSYYYQKGKYRGDLTSSLDRLLNYQTYFKDESVKSYFAANLQFNRELAQGLPEKENNYTFIAEHSENLMFSKIVLKHLIWLFNYPAIKIRETAMQSVFDLIEDKPDYLKTFIHFAIEKGSENEIEYAIVVLQAVALKNPKMLIHFKNELINVFHKEHFNILETARELFLTLNESDSSFLTADELIMLKALNTADSSIVAHDESSFMPKIKTFKYSLFQENLIDEINKNDTDNSILKALHSDLDTKGWADYNAEKESDIHHKYNINTNYDAIEIQSSYYDEVKASLNKIFYLKIKKNKFDPGFAKKVKNKFRLYDPSKLLFSVITRPDYITWLPEKISKQDFVLFNDFDSLIQNFITREDDFITLAEYGSQRVDRYSELRGTCYFEVSAFLKTKDYVLTKSENQNFTETENEYAYSLPITEIEHSSFNKKEFRPLVQISYNNFRGENDLVNASLNPDAFSNLGIKEKKLLDVYTEMEGFTLKAFRWSNSNKSTNDRRRYKPKSEGFTLKIRKDLLTDYLKKNNLNLCYNIVLRRSADELIPEDYMHWRHLHRNVEVHLK